MNRASHTIALAAGGLLLATTPSFAQTKTAADSTAGKAAPQSPATASAPMNISGVIFGSYNIVRPTTPAALPGQTDNAFVLDRAYLNFRVPAGDRTSVRITTDVYQSTENTPNAYTIRAKYAYLQYDAPKTASGAQVMGRIGILQNVAIDHIESFWPRFLSQTAIERAGFFSSSDVGLAGQLTLPRKMGEVYATIVNGPSYTSRERDRFKDYAIRLSLTPLANNVASPLWQTFTVTGWGYKGATGSRFADGGTTQVGAVGAALDRSRAGLFVGLKDPRLVLGAELAQRHDEGEAGANTVASPRLVTATTGRVLSGFTVVRPFAFTNASGKSPFGVVARYDRVSPSTSTTNVTPAPATSNAYHNVIAGAFWDLSQKAQVALDYQESLASSNDLSNAPPSQAKGYYVHFVVNF